MGVTRTSNQPQNLDPALQDDLQRPGNKPIQNAGDQPNVEVSHGGAQAPGGAGDTNGYMSNQVLEQPQPNAQQNLTNSLLGKSSNSDDAVDSYSSQIGSPAMNSVAALIASVGVSLIQQQQDNAESTQRLNNSYTMSYSAKMDQVASDDRQQGADAQKAGNLAAAGDIFGGVMGAVGAGLGSFDDVDTANETAESEIADPENPRTEMPSQFSQNMRRVANVLGTNEAGTGILADGGKIGSGIFNIGASAKSRDEKNAQASEAQDQAAAQIMNSAASNAESMHGTFVSAQSSLISELQTVMQGAQAAQTTTANWKG